MPIPTPKMDQIIGSFDDVTGSIDSASILDLLDFNNLTLDQLGAAGALDSLDSLGNLDNLSGITVRVMGATTTIASSASITAQIQPALLSGNLTGDAAATVFAGMIEEKTYAVTVASGSNNYGTGNKYHLDGSVSPTISLVRGGYYEFTLSDSSNGGHPLRFSTTPNGTHAGGSEYTMGVTVSGTAGSSGAKVIFRVPTNAPDNLYYYCSNHSGMGGNINVENGAQRTRGMTATPTSAGTIQASGIAQRPFDSDMNVAATIASVTDFKVADMTASVSVAATIADVTPNYIVTADSVAVTNFAAPFTTIQAICTGIFADSMSVSSAANTNTPTPEKLGEEWTIATSDGEVWQSA